MWTSRFAGRVLPAATVLLALVLLAPAPSLGQDKGKQPDFIPADYDDYQNMLDQLGIKKMRRGRDAKAKDTSDEATANPYKDSMPDLLTFKDKMKVTTGDQWPKRRAEIVEEFEREVYGRVPRNVPKVKWEVTNTVEGESGGIATVTKTLVGHVDNSDFPKIKVDIQASFTVPRDAAGKVPIILQFGGFGGGRGGQNSWTQQALDKAWGHGTVNPNSIQGDNSKLREGIVGLTNKGEPRGPGGPAHAHRPVRSPPRASSATASPTVSPLGIRTGSMRTAASWRRCWPARPTGCWGRRTWALRGIT
jgi:hypothetical protein